MTKETENNATGALKNAYPTKEQPPAPVDNTAELEQLKKSVADSNTRVTELETENSSLTKKLADVEHEKLVALAEQVADIKVAKKLLEEDKKADAVKELSKLSIETLNVLQKELSSVQVKLSDKPNPLSGPTDPPAGEPSAEEKKATELTEMRLKLFGHKEIDDEYYRKSVGGVF